MLVLWRKNANANLMMKILKSNLKEEDNNKFLSKTHIMLGMSYSLCRKLLVKNDKEIRDKEMVTVFNAKETALYCMNFLTFGPSIYHFASILIAKVKCMA